MCFDTLAALIFEQNSRSVRGNFDRFSNDESIEVSEIDLEECDTYLQKKTIVFMKRFYSHFHLFLMSMIMLSGLVTTHAQFQCYDLSGCQDYSNYGVRSTSAADLEYDNIISSWHSTIARDIDGSLKIWGENSQSDGTSHHTTDRKSTRLNSSHVA